MKRSIIQTSLFSKLLDELISKHRLLKQDYEDFEISLVKDPKQGGAVIGTGGIRKTRMKSSAKGKSGSYRVYYVDITEKGRLYLLVLYAKNVKEDLSQKEKKQLKVYIEDLKKELR